VYTLDNLRYLERFHNNGKERVINNIYFFPGIEKKLQDFDENIQDQELKKLALSCLPSAITSTFHMFEENGKPFTHVSNGDIDGKKIGPMWLRDASGQAEAYIELANQDPHIQQALLGIINMQAKYINRDPYANAFYLTNRPLNLHRLDDTYMRLDVHERKWEPDSLSFSVDLAYKYWTQTGDDSFADIDWANAARKIVKTFQEQQRYGNNEGPYRFKRRISFDKTEKVKRDGLGPESNKVGMIHSTHRPSDSVCTYPFHIATNLFAAKALRQLSEMHTTLNLPSLYDKGFAAECQELSDEITEAVYTYGTTEDDTFGTIFAYEVDGKGNTLTIDDASNPCLLSIPLYSDIPLNDHIYQNTRKFALSKRNPNFYKGETVEGIGSSHTGKDRICQISVMTRALTSNNDDEIKDCLEILKRTHNKDYKFGESVPINGSDLGSRDTRKWFPWPDSIFSSLILKLEKERPYLL
jgi:meiotically up-regulated gene 157 (Mug157) protein